ncbi:MAG: transposase [Flavobacteriales bacterium]|nr:transposase [Flavobacteriales bacterium]
MAGDKNVDSGTLRSGLEEVGTTGAPFWWDRGYVPHIEGHLLMQHVCFRLADSLPAHVVHEMWEELRGTPPSLRNAEMEKRVMAYLDAGHGSCVLRVPELANLVQGAFICFHGVRYTLHAWCVMPNHVDVLFQPKEGWTMSRIVAPWKSFTGRRISEWRKLAGLEPGGPRGSMSGATGVWQREYFDRYIRDSAHYANTVDYIHENPVKAGLVKNAREWKYSSVGGFSVLDD